MVTIEERLSSNGGQSCPGGGGSCSRGVSRVEGGAARWSADDRGSGGKALNVAERGGMRNRYGHCQSEHQTCPALANVQWLTRFAKSCCTFSQTPETWVFLNVGGHVIPKMVIFLSSVP